MKVVGITGSYGKTTTKEILHLVLSNKFKTIATQKNYNSDIGVANTINEHLGALTDVFIVEMGAYKRGEIEAICDIVKPDISILTSISEQHLALFGNIESTLKAKYEIIENSKPEAIVILNGDDDLVLRIAGKSDKKEFLYSTRKEVDLWVSDIKSKNDNLVFNVHYKDQVKRFEVRILGEHNISNILAATLAALNLGMSLDEIAEALKKGSKTKHIGRITVKKSKFGYKVIDDSYNSNADGFSAALDYLNNFEADKKYLVTIGIIELGDSRQRIYNKLGEEIIKVCDGLITSDQKLVEFVKKYNSKFNIIYDKGIQKQLNFLRNDIKKNDVVLFEGPNLRLIQEIV